MGHDRLVPTHWSNLFPRFCLQTYFVRVTVEDVGDTGSYEFLKCSEFRFLGENNTVQIDDSITFLSDHVGDAPQHVGRVAIVVCRVVVWEQLANVTECCGTEQCVGDRVQQHIRVTMSHQTLVMRDLNTTQSQRALRTETVCVVPYANSEVARSVDPLPTIANASRPITDVACFVRQAFHPRAMTPQGGGIFARL